MPRLSLILSILLVYASMAQAQSSGPFVGFVTEDGKYQLVSDLGIEQWEEGKLSYHRRQQWFLRCSYPDPVTNQPNTWCSLDRLVIDKRLTPSSGDIVNQHRHSVSDGTLKLVRVDWRKGVLDFTVVHTDKSTIEVMSRLTKKDDSLYLDSFKATGIARGVFSNSLTAIDYKIPK
jgi:hypothetical protein